MPENTLELNMDTTHDECVSGVVNVNRPYTSYTPITSHIGGLPLVSPLPHWEGHHHIAKPNLQTNHSLVWKLTWKQIPRMILHLFGNKSLILITTFLPFFFWAKPEAWWPTPLASTNPSSTLPWTTNHAPRRYASRLLPPRTSRRKAGVSAVCWEAFKVWRILGTTRWVNHGLKGSCHILRPLL